MTPIELLAELASLGVDLTTDGDSLKVDAPAGVLTPELQQGIRKHKQALIDLLRQLEALKATRLLRETGWLAVYSHALGEPVLWLRDEAVQVPEEWQGVPAYTLAELETLTKKPVPAEDDLKLLHEAKRAFRGVFVEAKACRSTSKSGSREAVALP